MNNRPPIPSIKARRYLKEVFGYSDVHHVDNLTWENIEENARERYPLDMELIAFRPHNPKTVIHKIYSDGLIEDCWVEGAVVSNQWHSVTCPVCLSQQPTC